MQNYRAMMVFVLLLLSPALALAQSSLGGDVKPGRALRLTITGEMKINFVDRNDSYFGAALGDAGTGLAISPLGSGHSGWDGEGGDFLIDPLVYLGIDAQLADGVNAIIKLETPFDWQTNLRDGNLAFNIGAAKVMWEGAVMPELTLELGIVEYARDFAGNGNPFLIDLDWAENPFNNPMANADLDDDGVIDAIDGGAPQSSSSGRGGSLQPTGVLGHYDLGDRNLALFLFNLDETDSETIFGAILDMPWDVGSYTGDLGLAFLNMKNDGSSNLWTVGGGGHLDSDAGELSFYGEFYLQFGKYDNRNPDGMRIIQDGAFAGYAGARYYLPEYAEERGYVDLSFWEVSGDDDGTDGKNSNFVSLENNNDSIVLEDAYYGLDVDANYRAFKVRGGMNLDDEWSVEALLMYSELQRNGGNRASIGSSSKLGDEIDIRATYRATDYLTFRFGFGSLQNASALGVGSSINILVAQTEVRF